MEIVANGAIAAAYFAIPLTLLPLLRTTKRDIRLNILLLILFVFSCGVGHTLSAMHLHSTFWHWVTAGISWTAVVTLLRSQTRLRYLGETFSLLEATWEQALTGKLLVALCLFTAEPAPQKLHRCWWRITCHRCRSCISLRQR